MTNKSAATLKEMENIEKDILQKKYEIRELLRKQQTLKRFIERSGLHE